ncbi:flagellar hook-associated protein FlgK [Arenibaculum pallidiluteum]|uniref:flagellar hook-associated protein FlgK n=1 Tax=Arenibaculum pallidiluteum TaxID=2812559 RepID=UPI001A96E31B|nr:flagellar hook-associated protein FlgK [Arenibaculum pallidiluteum]
MSIQMALNAALSGLKSTQQLAGLTSHNIANATTEGFVRKTLLVSSSSIGGIAQGVKIGGVSRGVDELLVRDTRFQQGLYSGNGARASALSELTDVLGQPQEERSIASAVAALRVSFQSLYGMPDNAGAQAGVVEDAGTLASRLRETAAAVTEVGSDAQERLAEAVANVNQSLHEVSRLNRSIATGLASGWDVSDLQDQRDIQLDRIAEEIGIRTYTAEGGEVVVMTRNGQMLLERELAPGETPLRITGGALMAGTHSLSADPDREIQSGRIKGLIDVADRDVPAALAQLDALAEGLIRGFSSAETDPTQPGLFTDAGGPIGAVPGLAARIVVNAALSGNAWRVQSGVQATAPLAPGDQTQIAKFLKVFTDVGTFATPPLPTSATLETFATAFVSNQHTERAAAENEMKMRKVSADTLQTARVNRDGVNVDTEMQKLLLIEQSYGASAQVIQTAGRMIDTLLQLGR